MIARVLEDPYVPTHWGKNQRGMQAERDVDEDEALKASNRWKEARMCGVKYAEELLKLGIHKQITNRLLEPFMWHTALITGTEWSNFFNLRDNKNAHPDFRDLAHAMRELYQKGEPQKLDYGAWHLPLVDSEDVPEHTFKNWQASETNPWIKVSVGRCARVSYLTHDGKRDPRADVDLCERLLASGHMSPFEHVARPMDEDEIEIFAQPKMVWNGQHFKHLSGEYTHFLGNVQGWVQYRKLIEHEEDILGER
jgi:thymidylate synthase ThyX